MSPTWTRRVPLVGATLCALALAACATPPREPHRQPPRDDGEPPPLVIIKKKRADSRLPPAPAPLPTAPAAPAPPAAAKGGLPGPADPAHTMTIHLLDVGQGAATLLEMPCGAILVDTGGEQDEEFSSIAELHAQLDAFFARRTDLKRTIDLLVITHPHIDHLRGVPDVLASYTVKNVVDNGLTGESNVRDQMSALREFTGGHADHYRAIKRDDIDAKKGQTDAVIDPLKCPAVDPVVRVLSGAVDGDPGWGESKYGQPHFANMNNHSVVVRVDFGKASVLITGDLEEVAIRDLVEKYKGSQLLDADVLQAGHHGSANGTTPELVSAVSPKIALIAMGPESRHHAWTAWAYGHPRESAVEMLEQGVSMSRPSVEVQIGTKVKGFTAQKLDRAIYGTGWDGPVDIVANVDGSLVVHTLGHEAPAR